MTDPNNWSAPGDPQGHPPPQYPQHPQSSPAGGPGPWGHGKPGVIPLRPLALGEILDGAFATMRKHAGVVFGSAAVVALLGAVIYVIADRMFLEGLREVVVVDETAPFEEQLDQMEGELGGVFAASGVVTVVQVLTQALLAGILTIVIGKAVLGKAIHFGEVWQELRSRLPALIGLTVVVTLIVAVGLLLFVIPGIWLGVLFSLATPALVLERGRVGNSLSRSRDLVSGSWWRVFGVLLVALLVTFVIGVIIQLPFELAIDASNGLSMGELLISELGGAVAATITAPFTASVMALLYIDQRMRKEGLDIELARAAGQQ